MAASGQELKNCETSRWSSVCLATSLDDSRRESKYTDVKLVVGNEESKKVFHAHKLILACRSPVFDKMFYGALAEKRDTIELDDDPDAFEMLLDFIYGKSNKTLSIASLWNFYIIGAKYSVPKIMETAKIYIDSISLTEESFWDIVQNNIFLKPPFLQRVKSYMMKNTHKVIASTKFLNAPESLIDTLLQLKKVNVQEYKLLLAVAKWINQTEYKTPIELFKNISFSSLKMDEFFLFLNSYPTAIDEKSSLEILHHLHDPSRRNLPTWCLKVERVNQISEVPLEMKDLKKIMDNMKSSNRANAPQTLSAPGRNFGRTLMHPSMKMYPF